MVYHLAGSMQMVYTPGRVYADGLLPRGLVHGQSVPELVEGIVHVFHPVALPVTGRALVLCGRGDSERLNHLFSHKQLFTIIKFNF